MPATKTCPACSAEVPITAEQIGGSITCPGCGKSLSVKRQEATPEKLAEDWRAHLKTISTSVAAIGRMILSAIQKFAADAQKRVQERKHASVANAAPSPVAEPTKTAETSATPANARTGWANLSKQQKDQVMGCGCLTVIGIGLAVFILPMLSNRGSTGEKKTFASEQEVRLLILGKSQDEVVQILGKPDWVNASQGRFTNGSTYDERWEYRGLIEHKATGKHLEFAVLFGNGTVIETEVKGGF